MSNTYTPSQKNVISYRGKDMLVSASAGTGKTTVMIERIASMLEEGADISEFVVVTFTNLAAAEMKNRLALKLAEKRDDKRLLEQIEKLDSANICTLHSFCSELLRNYFYVADIDPSYTILDVNLVSSLRKSCMEDVFLKYYEEKDEVFKKVFKIFAKARQKSNFENVLFSLYDFSRCIADFPDWYGKKRNNLVNHSENNAIYTLLFDNIKNNVAYYVAAYEDLYNRGANEGLIFAEVFKSNAAAVAAIRTDSLENALFDLFKLKLYSLPSRNKNKDFGVDKAIEEQLRYDFDAVTDDFGKFAKRFNELSRGEKLETLWRQTEDTVVYLDKLVEIIERFDEAYFAAKKERGGVDFNDLEHLTLKILRDDETLQNVRERYKKIFVDEYQDTNPVQEEIISRLASTGNLFMVGDVKQSIYGFRGCEPSIFVDKYNRFKRSGIGRVEELNDNFRSNTDILDFVNDVFCAVMTENFGKVNYKKDAQLRGSAKPALATASVKLDLIVPTAKEKKEIDSVYDITAENGENSVNKQGRWIVKRIKEYLGMAYRDKNGQRRIEYGDIVILMRSFKEKAVEIYNSLVAANIPVAASFKSKGYSNKEIKDIINLLRVLDNPYNDIYAVGVCLSPFGGFNEDELGIIRLDTDGRVPFYDRLNQYAEKGKKVNLVNKVKRMLALLDELRFYSYSAEVSEVVLKVMQLTQYQLYVQGLPNGAMRLRKLYDFINGVKGAAHAQSIDKFLSYLDEAEESGAEECIGQNNVVRMMTMHASKGLEFPVVIIADLEHRFHREGAAIDCNFDMGIAIKHYDFSTMSYAPTLANTAYSMYNSVKDREEEMRLLYVAMTRAKYALNLVGNVTEKQLNSIAKPSENAASHLDWILTTVKNKYKNLRDTTDGKFELNVLTETAEVSEETQIKLCPQQSDGQEIESRLAYEYPDRFQTDMPGKVVSSALDKAFLDGGDDETVKPAVKYINDDRLPLNLVGTAYHKLLQYAPLQATQQQAEETLESLVLNGQIESRVAQALDVSQAVEVMNNAELTALMSGGEVYRETPFMLRAPYNQLLNGSAYTDETMLQGVIDLLVIGKDSATVVDFKYTTRSDRVKDNYAAQLNSYRLAVQKICGIQNVDCYVLSIADNKLIKMS